MITVFHLSTSRSERIVWLLEELGLPYELEWHQREATGAAPAAMRDIHPIGKAPIIRDGDLVLAESGAIVEYIVQRHGKGRLAVPPESPAYAQYLYWVHFAEGSLMTLMLIALVLSRVAEAKESPVKERIGKRLHQMLAFVDGELAGRDYFAGAEFTAADVMMVFPFTTMRRYLDYDIAPYANITRYMKRIEDRPAYAKAMRIAGPDVKR
ncbi:MAG TPA: glutathione S-transferase [Usitatibacter sp.]|nr:glutathione S-transferase [Usitatibacter sp.]